MTRRTIGMLAHVDAGKTTLSEALLFHSGAIRTRGRVDRGDAFLDTDAREKARGITIFSKMAVLDLGEMVLTLMDTPGHVDFSAEMERTLQVLDAAVLLISGSEGVQAHTETLWRLLSRYEIPTVIFVNKMDLADRGREEILGEIREKLRANAVDFTDPSGEAFFESAATSSEAVLEEFLETGEISREHLRECIGRRELFPCWFGSALKDEGVAEFLEHFPGYLPEPEYREGFAAKVYKIDRDPEGKRLTYLRMTGGVLRIRDEIGGEKVNGIRLYSGARYTALQEAEAGMVVAVTGISGTRPGQGLGAEPDSEEPLLSPVMTWRLMLPSGVNPAEALPKLRELEEQVPEMHLVWDEEKREIHVQIMGAVQMEILKSLILERLGYAAEFGERSIVYRETITRPAEGVGHFEPLRHYAEVHLLLEPGERGSGLVFDDGASLDLLAGNWHRLILTHLAEKVHRGVLTGAPLTDVKITLMAGRAHLKHTEGGDFRQATYRAVRQGLMKAEPVLLEPYYRYRLEIPEQYIGRAMTDLGRMEGKFAMPVTENGVSVILGRAPVSEIDSYQGEVAAYTGGRGHLFFTADGYDLCHNAEEVIEASGYDPELDLRNPPGSVFCTHGAGFYVPWDEVEDYMHLESIFSAGAGRLRSEEDLETGALTMRGVAHGDREEAWIGTEEVDAILRRTYGANKKADEDGGRNRWGARRRTAKAGETVYAAAGAGEASAPRPRKQASGEKYLLVDGYNVIFAWPELAELAGKNIDSARDHLLELLCNFQGYTKYFVIAVFDAYRVKGHATEYFDYRNIHVVYTKEAETADRYIERFVHDHVGRYDVTVVTSDGLEQIIVRSQGAALWSSRDFLEEYERTSRQISGQIREKADSMTNRPFEGILPDRKDPPEA